MFDDVPFGTRFLGGGQDRVPIQHALAKRLEAALVLGLAFRGIVLGVDGEDAVVKAAQVFDRIKTAAGDPCQIQFGHDIVACRLEQDFQRGATVEFDHLEVMVVIGQRHVLIVQLVADGGQFFAQGGPACGVGGALILGQIGDGDDVVADRLVEGDHGIQVAAQIGQLRMGRDGLDVMRLEGGLQGFGVGVLHADRLDGGDARSLHRGQLFVQRAVIAQRVHLNRDRQLARFAGLCHWRDHGHGQQRNAAHAGISGDRHEFLLVRPLSSGVDVYVMDFITDEKDYIVESRAASWIVS